jgi:hypothetical protein
MYIRWVRPSLSGAGHPFARVSGMERCAGNTRGQSNPRRPPRKPALRSGTLPRHATHNRSYAIRRAWRTMRPRRIARSDRRRHRLGRRRNPRLAHPIRCARSTVIDTLEGVDSRNSSTRCTRLHLAASRPRRPGNHPDQPLRDTDAFSAASSFCPDTSTNSSSPTATRTASAASPVQTTRH